jgi:hypothetical protein
MKPSDVLGLVIRIVGFLVLTYGLWNVWAGAETLAAALLRAARDHAMPDVSASSYLSFGVVALAFGCVCFLCADWLVRLAYRERPD